MICTKDTPTYDIRKGMAFRYILKKSIEAQEKTIRNEFEIANTDAKAIAAIEVAETIGFTELAADLRTEFLTTNGREA